MSKLDEARAAGYSDDEIRAYYLSKGLELPKELQVGEAQVTGAQLPKALRMGMTALQGPTFGFGEEITSAIAAPIMRRPGEPLMDAYGRIRDIQRAGIQAYQEEQPIGSMVVQTAASLPLGRILPAGQGLRGAAVSGGVQGAIGGAGEAPSMADIPAEMIQSAIGGAGAGGAIEQTRKMVSPVVGAAATRAAGMVPGAIQDLISMTPADYARRRIAQAMIRDGATTEQVQARLSKLGDEAVIADAAGRNLKDLLDTMATLPGRTRNITERVIQSRQATRGGRLEGASRSAMGVSGEGLGATVEGLITKRAADSSPIYQQVDKMVVSVDDDLVKTLNSARELGAFSMATKIAKAEERPFSLKKIDPGTEASMVDLNYVKQGIDQLLTTNQAVDARGKMTPFGRSLVGLQNRLLARLDDATIDPDTGASVYAQARNAYAGPTRMIESAEFGRTVLNRSPDEIRSELRRMGDSELQAFRVGAQENLKMMAGTRAGQNKLLNMWVEPDTQAKLKEVFPSERAYREFVSRVTAERRMKELEASGRGSQTASREARMEDVAASQLQDTVNLAAAAKSMDVGTLLNMITSGMRRTAVPEPVRDEIGRILLSRAQSGDEIRMIREAMERMRRQQQVQTSTSGVVGGQFQSVADPFVETLKSLLQ